jgi:MoaA/NifB/PqqE/SkfB family radical SAM enzyme
VDREPERESGRSYGPCRLTVELTNACNLHCGYCLREEEVLPQGLTSFLSVDLLAQVAREAREEMGIEQIMFTGGEPTLHPHFGKILSTVAGLGLKCSFVTNGWHFERVCPAVLQNRETVTHVSFSLDGITAESHDRWRGKGSFVHLVHAFSRCWANHFPFYIKAGIRRDTLPQLENLALFAARMGAAGLNFAHIMPTSQEGFEEWSLTLEERAEAEREIALLARIFRMHIGIDVGYYNIDAVAPCSVLSGVSANLNYKGQLTLCCNLSGFRGGTGQEDIIADLNYEAWAPARTRLKQQAAMQAEKRLGEIKALQAAGRKVGLSVGSPCLFCLNSFGKTPWNSVSTAKPQAGNC